MSMYKSVYTALFLASVLLILIGWAARIAPLAGAGAVCCWLLLHYRKEDIDG